MLNIVICEDNPELLNLYMIFVKNYMHEHPEQSLNMILTTKNPNDVVNYIKNQTTSTLYILDIGFQNSNNQGISLAEQIRDITINSTIIFISTHENLKTLSLDLSVQPWDFIIKDSGIKNIKQQLVKDLNDIYNQLDIKKFYYTIGKRSHSIPINIINYLEVTPQNQNVVTLHSDTSNIQFIGNLTDIETTNDQLIKIQHNVLVNLDKIIDIKLDETKIILKHDTLTYDKSHLKNILERLQNN
ncbi:response regulator [Paucilactobacillus hokkaidonensis JCM 18461]|uniref:Response regulator n=2 Tax=Paucilactobacillus hokkaidonensis TaxID=1193095 RepID=A0A0A1GSV8_9LACO|nr:LytTR family transcriptional regulator DNA-binding domain-containing protein [Paucilactobacillus hokkaidonensis]KRO10111.1 hypothetical protein IV59_GL002132 [Paucilactobacillus hokkaidonensis]BAP85377.1 response regulator [Paucilactobacillus hokkaidonensis JCM 18461]